MEGLLYLAVLLEDVKERDMTNEPESTSQSIPATNGAVTPTTSSTPVMSPSERFARGDGMRALYARMRADQRTAVAGEFIRLLGLADDPQAQEFRKKFQHHTQVATDAKEELLSADDVATIDQYVRQSHPEMIEEMLAHPVTQSALSAPGEPAEAEEDTTANEEKIIIPTENVVTTGRARVAGGVMMEEGGEPYDRMVEDPHELSVGPDIEQEREQRAYEDEGEEAERPTDEDTGQNM